MDTPPRQVKFGGLATHENPMEELTAEERQEKLFSFLAQFDLVGW